VKWFFGSQKKEQKPKGVVGVNMTLEGISMTYSKVIPDIEAFEYIAHPHWTERQQALNKFVAQRGLLGVDCNYVLGSSDYILTLVDTPNVPQEEMVRAIPWLVRDMINFSIEEAVFDYFELPLPRTRDNIKMSYVITAKKSSIERIESLIKSSGLILKSIDIPEVAVRNMASRYPSEEGAQVFIQLSPTGGKVIVCCKGMISMIRSFNLNMNPLLATGESSEHTGIYDHLALEIQRSLDYSSSTFNQAAVNYILLMPSVLDDASILSYLTSALGVEIQLLELDQLLKFKRPISGQEQGQNLIAVGAVLRDESNP
jgi:MSHA biogenesis protein MshI